MPISNQSSPKASKNKVPIRQRSARRSIVKLKRHPRSEVNSNLNTGQIEKTPSRAVKGTLKSHP